MSNYANVTSSLQALRQNIPKLNAFSKLIFLMIVRLRKYFFFDFKYCYFKVSQLENIQQQIGTSKDTPELRSKVYVIKFLILFY